MRTIINPCASSSLFSLHTQIGYVAPMKPKPLKLEDVDLNIVPKVAICQRCFSIQTYNKLTSSKIEHSSFKKMLSEQKNRDVVVVKIMDLFNFSGSVIPDFPKIIGKKNVMLVINKIDLLPPKANMERIERWVRTQAAEHGINTVESVSGGFVRL